MNLWNSSGEKIERTIEIELKYALWIISEKSDVYALHRVLQWYKEVASLTRPPPPGFYTLTVPDGCWSLQNVIAWALHRLKLPLKAAMLHTVLHWAESVRQWAYNKYCLTLIDMDQSGMQEKTLYKKENFNRTTTEILPNHQWLSSSYQNHTGTYYFYLHFA